MQVNARNADKWTPAHVAAAHNKPAVIYLLGSPQGLADFDLTDTKDRTPADLAAEFGYWECVEATGRVVADDRNIHMHHRLHKEIDRQKSILRKKEILFGRSFMQVEGGHEFKVPASALVAPELQQRIGTDLRAFASAPRFLEQGSRAFLVNQHRQAEARLEERREMERHDQPFAENSARTALLPDLDPAATRLFSFTEEEDHGAIPIRIAGGRAWG
uniref:Uncharacterized protein n=1 Tax=Rhizochromulina marina TaxID=1034831 RepID=A0A7S2SS05_9STRA|mmetsp:Transcript_4818/g.14344  ORF Transcript_4818/g.14344 Transcript_4818/m.14344 type:complete len:217 (+) Transcript_4818:360-1010(+)